MNIQSTSQPSPNASQDATSLQLKEIEQATRKAKIGLIVWTLVAAAAYFLSGWSSNPLGSLMFQASVLSLIIGVVYAGRWSLARQLEGQIRAQRQFKEAIDWSDIPAGGFSKEIRLFASLEEAKDRGWKMGPAAGVFAGQEVPEWIEMEGSRFLFDGLSSPKGPSFVPENVRVLGRLRFIMPEAAAAKDTSQDVAEDSAVLGECKAS